MTTNCSMSQKTNGLNLTASNSNCVNKLSRASEKVFQTSFNINVSKNLKSSLVKSKKFGKKEKVYLQKKRVRFVEAQSNPKKTSFRECFVQFFHYIWNCSRTTVKIVLSKFLRYYNTRCLFSEC